MHSNKWSCRCVCVCACVAPCARLSLCASGVCWFLHASCRVDALYSRQSATATKWHCALINFIANVNVHVCDARVQLCATNDAHKYVYMFGELTNDCRCCWRAMHMRWQITLFISVTSILLFASLSTAVCKHYWNRNTHTYGHIAREHAYCCAQQWHWYFLPFDALMHDESRGESFASLREAKKRKKCEKHRLHFDALSTGCVCHLIFHCSLRISHSIRLNRPLATMDALPQWWFARF